MSRAITTATGTTDVQVHTGAATIVGVSVLATSATAAHIRLHDGTSTAGQTIVAAGAAGNSAVYLPVPAVDVTTGIFLDRALASGAGAAEVTVYVL